MSSADRERLRVLYEGAAIDVHCTDPRILAWLAEFLAPAFETAPVDASGPNHVVSFEVSAEAHARLAATPSSRREGFTQDGAFSTHQGFSGDGGVRWIHDARPDAFIGVSLDATDVRVVGVGEEPSQRLALLRVVRELATGAAHRRGCLPLHASAFVHAGGAVLVCGAKRAGKTSVLLHALTRGAAFLANDRVWVDVDDAPRARAMPTIVMLRRGTLELFPALAQTLERERYDRARSLDECGPGVARPDPLTPPGADRPGLSPRQLCHALRAPMLGQARVCALLLPRIDPQLRGIALTALPVAAARDRLRASLLEPAAPARLSHSFAPDGELAAVPPQTQAERCGRLASAVPAFECRLGPDAFAGDLLAELRRVTPGQAHAR